MLGLKMGLTRLVPGDATSRGPQEDRNALTWPGVPWLEKGVPRVQIRRWLLNNDRARNGKISALLVRLPRRPSSSLVFRSQMSDVRHDTGRQAGKSTLETVERLPVATRLKQLTLLCADAKSPA